MAGDLKNVSVPVPVAAVAFSVVVADQITKTVAFHLHSSRILHVSTNDATSMGVFRGPMWVIVSMSLFVGVASAVLVIRWTGREDVPSWVAGLGLGGAVSNAADRVLFGAVRDFLVSPWVLWNLADLAVVVGTLAFVWRHVFGRRRPSSSSTSPRKEVNLR